MFDNISNVKSQVTSDLQKSQFMLFTLSLTLFSTYVHYDIYITGQTYESMIKLKIILI